MIKMKPKFQKAIQYGVLVFAVTLVSVTSQGWMNTSGNVKETASRKAMPHLDLPLLGGGTWHIEDQRGKVVLVNFWASWCPPCREETPGLVKLSKEYKARGLSVVGIAMDEGGDKAIRSFVDEYHLPYPVGVPTQESALISSVESLPTTILVDRRGRIAKTYMGAVRESVFQADVEHLLAEGTERGPDGS